MPDGTDLVSPKQAARAIGVSESSLKRWCDQGLLRIARTAGGHRKLPIAEVLRFARQHNHPLACPEILGLPAVSPQSESSLSRAVPLLTEALLSGDELLSRQILIDLYQARHRLSVILDDVMAAAFREIGDRWECHQAEIYQERRGCEIAQRMLFDLRRLQTPPSSPWTAIGATASGDQYTIPMTMAELVLRENGWQATSLGVSIPMSSLIHAVQTNRPALFWLSVSYVSDPVDFLGEFAQFSQACSDTGSALVVGGRALTQDLRQKMTYSTFCDTMQQLERFIATLQHSGKRRAAAGKKSPSTDKTA